MFTFSFPGVLQSLFFPLFSGELACTLGIVPPSLALTAALWRFFPPSPSAAKKKMELGVFFFFFSLSSDGIEHAPLPPSFPCEGKMEM